MRRAAAKRTAFDELQKELLLERKRSDLYKQQAEAVQRQYEVACRIDAQRQKDVQALERRLIEQRIEGTDKDVKLAELQIKLGEAAKRSAGLEREALTLKLQMHGSDVKAPPASAGAVSAAVPQVTSVRFRPACS
jgi:hypothetical protein